MALLTFDRYGDELVLQTDLLRTHVKGADLTAPVPTTPGWNLGQLLRHVGGDHRWAETVVRTRADGPVSDQEANDLAACTHEDGAVLDPWLADGAALLAGALRAAGPDALMWNPSIDDRGPALFWARRMLHETVVHRADAALATGAEFTVEDDVARDGVAEYLEFSTVPEAFEPVPDQPGLLGPGRILHFGAGGVHQWWADLTGDRPVLRREPPEEAAVSVHGPHQDLLLFLYGRPAPAVEILGDTALLDLWLRRTRFWLQ